MRQAAEIKQETPHRNSSVAVMLHGINGDLTLLESLLGLENAQWAWHHVVSLDANAFFLQPSLSQKLTGKAAITEGRLRYRRVSFSLSKSFLAEAHLALAASCVLSGIPNASMDADAPRLHGDKQQYRYLTASRPCVDVTLRMPTHPRSPRSLEAHALKNAAARPLVACGPETHGCVAAACYLN